MTMPRPQFSLKTLLWLMGVVAVGCVTIPLLWHSLPPVARMMVWPNEKNIADFLREE
ncbi:MAG TPA: hypothetical protein VNH11_00215 [Pirellulales bacterium]|nr:hypothetical protein [Pirellulales bacterium]